MTQLLTISEAAERLRVSVRTLEREARDGRLAIVRIRSVRLVAPAELDRYIAAQSEIKSPSVKWETDVRSAVERVFNARPRPEPVKLTRAHSTLRFANRVRRKVA